MVEESFIRIKDIMEDDEQLFSGSEILLYVDTYTYSGKNNLQMKEKGFQDIGLTAADAGDTGSNYNRRKSNVSYIGFPNPTINISGFMSEIAIGSETKTINGVTYVLMNPNRFMKIINSGRTLRLNDDVLIRYLKSGSTSGDNYFDTNGMPIVIDSWTLNPILGEETKGINWNLTIMEDKKL